MLNTEIPWLSHKKLGRWFLKLFTNSTSSAPHLQLLQDPKFSSAVWMERLELEFLVFNYFFILVILLFWPLHHSDEFNHSDEFPIACQGTLNEIKLKHSPRAKHGRENKQEGMGGEEAEEEFLILFSSKKLQDTGRCHSPGCWELGHCNLSSTRDFGCSNTVH